MAARNSAICSSPSGRACQPACARNHRCAAGTARCLRGILLKPTREDRMGFMDKAKKLAEQAQEKLDEAQKNFNKSQEPQARQGEGVRYDDHGRPIQEETPRWGGRGGPGPAPPPSPAAPPPTHTRHSVELTERAHEVGVDAMLVVT